MKTDIFEQKKLKELQFWSWYTLVTCEERARFSTLRVFKFDIFMLNTVNDTEYEA